MKKTSIPGTRCPKTLTGRFTTACTRKLLPLLSLLALPGVVQAQDYTYTVNNGTVTITGCNGNSWFGPLTIPSTILGLPVTSIGYSAFSAVSLQTGKNSYLVTSVTIPDSVTSIGDWAFFSSPYLTNVTLGNGVTSIGYRAFEGCASLASISIPNSVTSIGDWAFLYCASLRAITVDSANPNYTSADGVLFNKSQSRLIQCPGAKAGTYTIPNTVTSIGDNAFASCYSLTSVTIPNSVTSIESEAFSQCGMTNVTIPNSVTSIGDAAFMGCPSLTNVTLGNSITSIGQETFVSCSNLTSVTLGNNITSIGYEAFGYCSSLTSVTIPNGVTSIGADAFFVCTALTKVTIPSSVTSIGYWAFSDCANLTAITVDAFNSIYSSVGGVMFDKSRATLVEYPGGLGGSYTIPNSVTNIGYDAFFGCTSLTNVTIPNSVTSIAEWAFGYCTNLTRVYFQGNAPSLGGSSVFSADNNAAVYYVPGTTGWGATFGGRPTALWLPQMQTGDASLGVGTNGFGFTINWASGMTLVVEASTNLVNPIWSPLATNTLTSDSVYFSDPGWTNYPARFYRIRWP